VTSRSTLLHKAWYVFQKDLHQEFRTRYAINAIFLFAVTTLIVVSFSIGPAGLSAQVLSPLLWIIIFFSAMSGLSHIFVREEEQQTSDTLRLVAPANAIFLGKWLFNAVLLIGLEILIVPLYLIFMNLEVKNPGGFAAIILLGSLGVSTVATIIAAIISRASARGALFAVLSFPITLPILVSAIHGTGMAIAGRPMVEMMGDYQILFAFLVVIFTASVLLFEFIWII